MGQISTKTHHPPGSNLNGNLHFMGTFTMYVVIALVAHALVWADKPWLPI